jgi:group I intron endonuclease
MTERSGIYEIVNKENGKRYVGSATEFSNRWSEHQCDLNRGRHHSRHLQAAWNKYGRQSFTFNPVLICAKQDLLMYEQIVMDFARPEYNILCIAGSSIGRKATPETRAKISATAIGRKRSPESIERGAAKRRGVPLKPEHAAKLIGNKYALGLKHTSEWKAANSLRNLGKRRPKDAAYRAKISASLKGRKATPEHRANQSAAQLGKKRGRYKIKGRK